MLGFQATWYLRYHTNGPTVDLVTHQGMLMAQEGTLMAWQGHLRTGSSYWNAYEFKEAAANEQYLFYWGRHLIESPPQAENCFPGRPRKRGWEKKPTYGQNCIFKDISRVELNFQRLSMHWKGNLVFKDISKTFQNVVTLSFSYEG